MFPIGLLYQKCQETKKEDRGGRGEPPRNVGVYMVILNQLLWPYNDRDTITIFHVNGYLNHKLDVFFEVKSNNLYFFMHNEC